MSDEELTGRIDDPDDDRVLAAFLDAVGPELRDQAVWVEPPEGLADTIIAAIAAERAETPERPSVAVPTAVPTAQPARATARRRWRARTTWVVSAAAAAAIAAIAIGVVVTMGDGDAEVQFAIEGTGAGQGAEATAEVNELGAGVAIALDVEGLPAAPEGFYYQGWVRNADDEAVTVGTFHMRGGDATVNLWSGVDVSEYSTLTVTLQREGEGAESSGDVVLRGSIVP